MKIRGAALVATAALALTLTACEAEDDGAGEESTGGAATQQDDAAEPDEEEAEPEPEPKKEYDGKAFVAKVRKAASAGTGGQSFDDMCNPTEQNWQCFYEGISSKQPGRLDLKLAFPGDVDESDLSKRGRMWFLNMTGKDVPELKQIVSYNSQGVDTGTSNRSDSPILD